MPNLAKASLGPSEKPVPAESERRSWNEGNVTHLRPAAFAPQYGPEHC